MMNPSLMMVPDTKFRQRWEFRDGRSELSSDDSLSDNYDKTMQERSGSASQLPAPENDQGKDHSSSLKAKKVCKPGVGNRKKAKSDKKKWPDFVNLGGVAGIFDISISNELQVHMRSVLEDLDAERWKMSTWMREEVEKMSANGAAPQGRGKNCISGHTCTRKITGSSNSKGQNEINSSRVPGKDGNNSRKAKAADSKHKISHDNIPLNGHNILAGPGSRENPQDIIGPSSAIMGISNEQSLIYCSPPNGFLNYSATIPRTAASPLLSNSLSHGMTGSRPVIPGGANAASTHPGKGMYTPVPVLTEAAPRAGGQLMENFWIDLTNSMVSRFD
ncbi:hypothetical protein MLD38_038652 [Melastoma candidum]|uniref:Uncharacterized protein n=1 Tax=Melastoma candidum TaxID=119954 RepID=A0ACB9KZT9_9MYRT|nr:hypothetical protein MLD38_038652 [Melastoma candidum]